MTRDVARELGTTIPHLHAMLRAGRLAEPARDSSNRYVWTPADVEAARAALATDRRRKEYRRQEVSRG